MKPPESVVIWSPGTLSSKLPGVTGMRPRYHPLQLVLTGRVIAVLSQWKLLCGLLDCVHLGLCGAFLVQNRLEQEVSIEITVYHRPSCFVSTLTHPSLVLLRTTQAASIAPSFCLMCRLRPSKVPGHSKNWRKWALFSTDLPAYFHFFEHLLHLS